MKNFLDKIFLRSNNLDYVSQNIKDLSNNISVHKIFSVINNYSSDSEIRYVGGCIRKIIIGEKVDDIDLATNVEPKTICEILKKNNIVYYESGIDHGTVTALIDNFKFEITSLREDILTDGRHAKVKFSKSWKNDASRRDFTINSIYSDMDGNIFDPYEGKRDLENGFINFIGDADKRLKEDYLRILRYFRFFLNYSNQEHNPEILKIIRLNMGGISKLSKERLLDELKKLIKFNTLVRLSKDKLSLSIILIIFPELKNISFFSRLDSTKKKIIKESDFIFLLSFMIVDNSDNTDYFLFKYNISKKNKKRIKLIDNFYKEKIDSKTFTKQNLNKIFYYHGKKGVLDILNYRILKTKKIDHSLNELLNHYENSITPKMPINADMLMKKYEIPEGKRLGEKLKAIEEEWVENNFEILDRQVDNIINS